MKKVVIYTDGACLGNPGKGGWAYVRLNEEGSEVAHGAGKSSDTTNNRMELMGPIRALEKLLESEPDCKDLDVEIFTDSQYVQKGISEWIKGWKVKGWFGSNKKPVKNKDLWVLLDSLPPKFGKVTFTWVKGHAGNKWNEYVDNLANKEAGIVV